MKKIVLFSFALFATVVFSALASAYCIDCYYGNTQGYENFAEHTYSNAYTYERPFGHSYYYQPFTIASNDYSGFYGSGPGNGVYGYNYVKPRAQVSTTTTSRYFANRYNQPSLAYTSNSNSYNYENRYGEIFIGTEQHYTSPYTHSVTSRNKVYGPDGYLVYSDRTHSGYSFNN
ncbi:hypothetical protein COU57_01295 [Candidatus Pacearchaeota archaeon CG10_big_fil_rev_8_21_14_0_10_32_14]|nr:MAG: hypothetical protein COU57_01295 [Candidatus Pacearchaeota archaeon CG10_big_fil_rev_8_21_14_0_10_32_14]